MSKVPDREIIHRRPRAEVRANAERLAKEYADHLRQGKAPLSLAGLTPVEKKRVLEEEEKVFLELEAAGKPVIRRVKKPRVPKDEKLPEELAKTKHLRQAVKLIEKNPDETTRIQNLEQMLDEAEKKSSELMRREAILKVREEAVAEEETDLRAKRRKAEKEASQIVATAQMNADGIAKRAREMEKKAEEALKRAQMATPEEKAKAEASEEVMNARQEAEKIRRDSLNLLTTTEAKINQMLDEANVEASTLRAKNQAMKALQADLAMTMSLPEAEAKQFLALANDPPLNRNQIAKRMEIYTSVYQNLRSRATGVPDGGFCLHKTVHIQGAGGYSVKWTPSNGKAPLAAPEAEVLLRILAETLAAEQNPRSGVMEIAFIDKVSKKVVPLLRALLPGNTVFLDHYRASPDMIVGYSMEEATSAILADYPEKIGWQCSMKERYRFGRLAVRSGCFVLSFAANYRQEEAKRGVLGVFIALLSALSHLAVARCEMNGIVAGNEKSSATTLAILRRTEREFSDTIAPEIQGWNAWRQSFKPTLWQISRR